MFGRRPIQRLTTTIFVVLSLLFSQLALANYACPAEPAQDADAVVMHMAAGEPCQGMAMPQDTEQPVLCHQHCVNAPQSFDPLNAPAVTLPAIVQVVVVPLLLDADAAASAVQAQRGPERPPPDPLFLSTLRLRV